MSRKPTTKPVADPPAPAAPDPTGPAQIADPDPPPKWKVCRRCKRLLSVALFQRLNTRHHSYCKSCVSARTIELRLLRYSKHPDYRRAKNQQKKNAT